MPDPGLATAADYSEALLTARRAKSLIALILAIFLIGQIAIFLLLRYDIVKLPDSSTTVAEAVNDAAAAATSQPIVSDGGSSPRMIDLLHYVTGLTILGGIALSIVLAFILCLIGHVMLVGRLIGVGRVTSALIWTLVLIVFLFPWQFFMNNAGLAVTDFRVPGVLWTWDELVARYKFSTDMGNGHWADVILSWFRFVGAPAVALILVLAIQFKSNRGLKMALGEDEVLNEMMRQS